MTNTCVKHIQTVFMVITTLFAIFNGVRAADEEPVQNTLLPVDENSIFSHAPLAVSSVAMDIQQCSDSPGKEFDGTLGEVHARVNPFNTGTPSTHSSGGRLGAEGVDEESPPVWECLWTITVPDQLFLSILVDVMQPCKTDSFTLTWPDERNREKLRTVNCDSRSVVALTSTNTLKLTWTDRYVGENGGETRFKVRFQATEKPLFNKLRVVFATEFSGFITPVGHDGHRLVRVNAETVYRVTIPEMHVVMMSFQQRQKSLSSMVIEKGIVKPTDTVRVSEQLGLAILHFSAISSESRTTHPFENLSRTVSYLNTTVVPSTKIGGGRFAPSAHFSGGPSLVTWLGQSSIAEHSTNDSVVLVKVDQTRLTITYREESHTFLTEADGCIHTGFKLRFSFHPAQETPEYVTEHGKKQFNCSVPYYESFKQHVHCNLERECQGGEDEGEQCPYSPTGCQGNVGYKNKCFYILPEPKRFISATANEKYCQETGGNLAEFKTKKEWDTFTDIFRFGKTSYNYVTSTLRMSRTIILHHRYPYYFETVLSSARGISYELDVNVYQNYPYNGYLWIFYSPEWSPVLSAWLVQIGNQVYIACQRETVNKDQPASTKAPPLQVPKKVTYFSRAENVSLGSGLGVQLPAGLNHRNYLVSCPGGHVTRDFLSCDPRSQCGVVTFEPTCQLLNYASEAGVESIVPMYVCNDNKTVHYTLLCDGYMDCDSDEDVELCEFTLSPNIPLLYQANARVRIYRLPPPTIVDFQYNANLVQKKLGDSQTCPETHFQCPGESSHCLPVYVRCNTYRDCPGGEDEAECESYQCPGFYRCRSSRVCLHIDHLCDGLVQCPEQDDELLCDAACPKGCDCQGLAFLCHSPVHPDAVFHPDVRYLDASGSGLQPERLDTVKLLWLSLASCGIETAPSVHLTVLSTFDLSQNRIRSFDITAVLHYPRLRALILRGNPLLVLEPLLTNLTSLRPPAEDALGLNGLIEKHNLLTNLDLSYTRLQVFNATSLAVFSSLQSLNLSFSEISKISDAGFSPVRTLQILDVRENSVKHFPADLFKDLSNLRMLYTTNFELCCPDLLPLSFDTRKCFAAKVDISSCANLLMTEYRVFLWVIGVLAIVGNAGSFIYRVLVQRKAAKSGFSVFVSCLCVADFLMGVNLVIVGTADDLYKGKYYLYKSTWTTSAACKTAGFLCLLSSEVSAFIISLITLDRFIVLRFPFSTLHFQRWSAHMACGAACGLGALLAAIPFLPGLAHWDFYGQTGLCIPLPVTRRSFRGRDYSFSIMVVLNFLLFVLIALGQACIYWSIRQNSMAAENTKASQDLTIARRLITVALSDFLCWFPIGLLGLLARDEGAVSSQFTIFVAVFALPFNSALNPFLYTYNVVQEKRKKQAIARLLAHARTLAVSSKSSGSANSA